MIGFVALFSISGNSLPYTIKTRGESKRLVVCCSLVQSISSSAGELSECLLSDLDKLHWTANVHRVLNSRMKSSSENSENDGDGPYLQKFGPYLFSDETLSQYWPDLTLTLTLSLNVCDISLRTPSLSLAYITTQWTPREHTQCQSLCWNVCRSKPLISGNIK